MKTCWYIVIEAMGAWWVDCEGKAFGPFDNEEDARSTAPRIALTYGDETRRSEVWATEPDGTRRCIWAGPNPS